MNPTDQGQPQDLTSYFNDPRLAQAQDQYQAAQSTANESASGDISLPAMLKQALNEKFGDNNPMIQSRQSALEGYLNSIPEAQKSVLPENNGGVILSPIQQADLISKRENAKLAPLSTLNTLLGLQSGGITDVINAASAAHQAATEAAGKQAEYAHQNYQDILNELSTKANLALQERSQGLTAQRFAFDIQGGMKGLAQKQLTAELQAGGKNGITLKDALQKYGNQLTPDEIYGIYNTSSGRGPATENSAQLSTMKIAPTAQSQLADSYEKNLGQITDLINKYKEAKSNPVVAGIAAKIPWSKTAKYEQLRNSLSAVLANISGGGAGTNLRISQSELDRWASLLPDPRQTEAQNKTAISSLDNNLRSTFHGRGLPPEILQQFGITPLNNPSGGRPPLSSFNK